MIAANGGLINADWTSIGFAEYFSNPAYIIHIDFLMGGVGHAAIARAVYQGGDA